jgi:polyhydroxybutyrate depolymerase
MRACSLFASAALIAGIVVVVACGSDDPLGTNGGGGGDSGAEAAGGGDGGSSSGDDGATGGDSSKGPNPKVTNESVTVNGAKRTYVLAVPETYDAGKKYPLVLAFHGDGGTGASFRAYYKFDAQSGEDAVVAYLDGIDTTWDIERLTNNADVAFAEQTIQAVAGKVSIDTTRVFATGWSSGGFFVNRFACMRSTLLRGISSHEGGAPYESPANQPHPKFPNGYPKCNGEDKVAAFIVHNTGDGTVEFASGDFDASYWAYVNGCNDNRAATSPSPCVAHQSCPADKPVVFCPIPANTHGIWPDGAKQSWAFFKALL